MTDQPSVEQMCHALADVLEAHGTEKSWEWAACVRADLSPISDLDFATIAVDIGVHPTQLFQAYAWRIAHATGWVHPTLGQHLEAQGWIRS